MKTKIFTLLALGGVVISSMAQDLEQMVAKQIKENFPKGVEQTYVVDKLGVVDSFVDTCTVNVFVNKIGQVSVKKTKEANIGNPTNLYRKIDNRVYGKIQLPLGLLKYDTIIAVEIPTRYRLLRVEDEKVKGRVVPQSPLTNVSTMNRRDAEYYDKQYQSVNKQGWNLGVVKTGWLYSGSISGSTVSYLSKQNPIVSVFEIDIDF